jgi:hypothetical protein
VINLAAKLIAGIKKIQNKKIEQTFVQDYFLFYVCGV